MTVLLQRASEDAEERRQGPSNGGRSLMQEKRLYGEPPYTAVSARWRISAGHRCRRGI
jgi:hypothetical protein